MSSPSTEINFGHVGDGFVVLILLEQILQLLEKIKHRLELNQI